MQCPRTGAEMKEVEIGGVKVDVSTGCGGVWFDNFELKKFDEPSESAGDELIRLMETYRKDNMDLEKRLPCPRHPDVVMQRHFFSVKEKVVIDECPQCGGIWLDPGELLQIRELFPNEEARNKAGEEFVTNVLSHSDFQKMAEKGEQDLVRARRFAGMFRLICPTNYIPGKQSWGAF